jgi:hypothetical protein
MINEADKTAVEQTDYHDRTISAYAANPPDKRRRSTMVSIAKKEDPFTKTWADGVPVTFKEKAVWEYDSETGTYIPYLWGSLRLNPKIKGVEVENVFRSIKSQVPAPAKPIYCPLIIAYFFLVHVPLVFVITLYFYNHLADESADNNEIRWVSTKYVAAVVFLTLFMLFLYFYFKYRYRKSLIERTISIEGILEHFNTRTFGSLGMRFCAGKLGSWIEAQFLDPSVYMEGQDNGWYTEAKRNNSLKASKASDYADNHIPCSLDSNDNLRRSLV